jgi:hypothetical protein
MNVQRFLAVVVLCLAFGSRTHAQTDFSQLRIQPGTIVYVTRPDGIEITGPLTALAPLTLSIDGYDFHPIPGLTIKRRGDPIWDGAAWGLGSGLFLGMLIASGECGVDWPASRCIAAGGLWGAAFGTVFDLAHIGRTTVFRARRPSVHFAPTVSTRLNGLLVRLSF